MSADDNALIEFVGVVHPLKTEPVVIQMPEGLTLGEMLRLAQPDPALLIDACVFIDDHEIPRVNWEVVRPREGHVVTARIIPYPRGSGKNPLRLILMIAIFAASFFFAGPLGASLGFSTVAGSAGVLGTTLSMASLVGGAIISIAGQVLINAIAPIKAPALGNLSGDPSESPSLFLEGSSNSARRFAVVPQVLGFFRFRPPLGAVTVTEVNGNDNILRMLLVPGYGELDLSEWQINTTPIEQFKDANLTVRSGLSGDAELDDYPSVISQQEFSIFLESPSEPQPFYSRTSDNDADELSIDFTFPQGLVEITGAGNRSETSIELLIQFRKVGDIPWINLPADTVTTLEEGSINGPDVTFTAARTVAVRHGFRWKVTDGRAQYEVQVRRNTLDTEETTTFDKVFWTVLRTITLEDPISFRVPLAKATLSIRATNQLSGVVGSLSVLAKSVVPAYTGTPDVWTDAISNNPAALFRHVLQGPAKAQPVPDSLIDITKLEEWYDFCVSHSFTFNQVRDFSSSIQAVLEDICASGRAGLTIRNGKWSVVIDDIVSITTTHITPHNSTDFELEKSFHEIPHAWRFRFPNEEENYEQDERLIFFDGFSETGEEPGKTIATLYSELEIPGVTNPTQAFRLGRYFAAVIAQRPERWSVKQDFENIVAVRGSRVKLTHDVMVVGLSSGRIKSLTVDGGGGVDTITVDEPVFMEAGNEYGLVIRRDVFGETSVSGNILLDVGQQTVLTISPVIPAGSAPSVGDLFGFGIRGTETEDALVLANIPEDDIRAKIIMVPYRPAVFDADSESVPAYVPNVSPAVFLPIPVIQEIVTDESVLDIGEGNTTLTRAQIRVLPIADISASLDVQQRISGTNEPFYNSHIVFREGAIVRVGNVSSGESYVFRVRWRSELLSVPSLWATASPVVIIGNSSPPQPLVNFTVTAFGGQALLRWDQPIELDVRFGGTVQFRHTTDQATPAWEKSSSIGQNAQARSLFATVPLKLGTYIARVFDNGGLASTVVFAATKQSSVLTFTSVDTLDEHTTFVGTHVNTVSVDSQLKLSGDTLIDDVSDFDAILNLDGAGGISPSGTYTFFTGFDLTTVKNVRLTTRVTVRSENINDLIDTRTLEIDSWEDFDGVVQAAGDLIVEVRSTDDNPSGSPTWSEWGRLEAAEFEARGFQFRALLTTNDPAFNLICTILGVDVEEVL